MADDIKSSLADLISARGNVDKLQQSLEKLNQMKASVSLDATAFAEMEKLTKAIESQTIATKALNEAKEEFAKVQKEAEDQLKKDSKLSDEIIRKKQEIAENVIKLTKDEAKYSKVIVDAAKKEQAATENAQKQLLEFNEAKVDAWKKNTLLGKSYSAGTSQIAKMTAGIGFAALGMKALGRFTDAARLRNNLMIASYGSLSDSYGRALSETMRYESAMRGASATAKYLGMANEDVSGIMMKYQRIVGKSSPEALEALTSATLATAKAMGIDSAEAISYVSARMDNFGGTAQGALTALQELRSETKMYNTELAGVSIRGDDVVKTIQDITNSNNVYAVDQRFLAQTLMRTSATLQANGESYNFAQKMASNYTKSLSSEAPEWMKITNSFDITKEIMNNRKKDGSGNPIDELTGEMAAKLEKAKPGLSKKVNELLSNKQYSSYDKTRLLGEMLGDTQVGMTLMSKKIVDLGKSSITTLASVYGKSYMEAEEMYKAALKTQELEESTRVLKGGASKEEKKAQDDLKSKMQEKLDLSDEGMALAMKDEESQRRALEAYSNKVSMEKASLAIAQQKRDATILQGKLEEDLAKKKAVLASATTAGDKEQAQLAVDEAQKALDDAKAKAKKGEVDAKMGDTGKMKGITDAVKEDQGPTALLTGDLFRAKFEELSSPIMLLSAGALAFFATSSVNGVLQTALLAKIAGTSGAGSLVGALKDAIIGEGTMGGALKGAATKVGVRGIAAGGAGVLAAGMEAYSSYKDYKEAEKNGASKEDLKKIGYRGGARTVGAGVGAGVGMWGGAAAGAAIGSVVPVVGTAIGGLIGGAIGAGLGAWGGAAGAGATTDAITGYKAPSNKSREGLVKTTTDQSVQQARVVQQALQSDAKNNPPPSGPDSNNQTSIPSGSFGAANPDGSITLKIDNFMPAVAGAMADAKTRR